MCVYLKSGHHLERQFFVECILIIRMNAIRSNDLIFLKRWQQMGKDKWWGSQMANSWGWIRLLWVYIQCKYPCRTSLPSASFLHILEFWCSSLCVCCGLVWGVEAPAMGPGIVTFHWHALTHNQFSPIKLIMLDHLPVSLSLLTGDLQLVHIGDCSHSGPKEMHKIYAMQRV